MSEHRDVTPPAAVLLGREIVSSDPAAGDVVVQFLARPEFANRHGTVQGGLLAAMLDSATANAVFSALPPDLTAVTTRLDTRFLKPAALGPVTARARVTARDERSATVEADLTDANGRIVARAQAELRLVPRRS